MKSLVLCWFDAIFGPRVFLRAPEGNNDELKHIPPLMDLYKEGFFYHEFGKDKSANLSFQLPSGYARGNNELLMLSYIVRDGDLNPTLAKDILTRFTENLTQIKDGYKGFYIESAKHPGDPKKLAEIKELFENLYHSFPAEVSVFKTKERKIFVFGLTKAGKTSILHALQRRFTKELKPTIFMDISKILIPDTNVSIMVYDAPGQIKYRDMWAPSIVGQDGLVFVVDVADKERFLEAKHILHDVSIKNETRNLPILLLFNKIDLKKPKVKDLVKILDIPSLGARPIHYFETSAITGEGLVDAFGWLAKELSR